MNEPPVALSVSKHFHNKENRAPLRPNRAGEMSNLYAHGAFDNVSWTPGQIAKHVTSGKAICVAATRNDWRKSENFVSSQIMGVDFDNGQGVQALTDDTLIEQYAFLVYPTPSSSPQQPRSRALFLLDQPIADPDRYRCLLRRLLLYFQTKDADEACKDAVRMFYGSTHLGYIEIDRLVLPIKALESLPPHPRESIALQRAEEPFVTSSLDNERYRTYVENAVENELHDLRTSGSHRNEALFLSAVALGELVGASWTGLARTQVEMALMSAAQSNGYTAKDGETAAKATIRSGMERGMSEPRAYPRSAATVRPPSAIPIAPAAEIPKSSNGHPSPISEVAPTVAQIAIVEKPQLRPKLPDFARLTGDQVREAEHGRVWLNRYLDWAVESSPLTPRLFHEAMGLWLLATASTRRMCVRIGGETIFPNLYVLIVGRTTIYRKSTAMNLAKSILQKANLSPILLPADMTPEALFDELAGVKPSNYEQLAPEAQERWKLSRRIAAQRSFFKDEVSTFFANMRKDYMQGFEEFWTQGYDAAPGNWDRRLKSSGVVSIKDPCLSFLGATTPGMYGKYVGTEFYESGLLPRFAIITPEGREAYRNPADEIPDPQWIVERLTRFFRYILPWEPRATDEVQTPPHTFLSVEPEAMKSLLKYRQAVGDEFARQEVVTDIQSAFYSRLATMCFKVATLLAGISAESASFRVEPCHAFAAQLVCEQWRESLHRLDQDVSRVKNGESDDNKVLALIRQSGVRGVTLRQIMQDCNIRPRAKAVDALTVLADDGLIEKIDHKPEGRGRPTTCYRMVGVAES